MGILDVLVACMGIDIAVGYVVNNELRNMVGLLVLVSVRA